MLNTPTPAAATGLPDPTMVRPLNLPSRMTRGEEFLALMDQRKRLDARLTELADSMGADSVRLPKSGLRLVAVSVGGPGKGGVA